MSLDKATVARIARLARIRLDADEQARLVGELSNILSFVEQLEAVDVEGIEPMTSAVAHELKMRDDVVTDGGDRDGVLANAPATERGFFVVPKVVE
ncbi:MAG: Asp-tRNA(Asn)/Glu-tRNA(Gln) amidotransferase subunit GatC [Alphaproteobacteria bacterium]